MTSRHSDLTTDASSAERIARQQPTEAEVRAVDARSGGDPSGAPRSFQGTELRADDEALAASDEWDEAERL